MKKLLFLLFFPFSLSAMDKDNNNNRPYASSKPSVESILDTNKSPSVKSRKNQKFTAQLLQYYAWLVDREGDDTDRKVLSDICTSEKYKMVYPLLDNMEPTEQRSLRDKLQKELNQITSLADSEKASHHYYISLLNTIITKNSQNTGNQSSS